MLPQRQWVPSAIADPTPSKKQLLADLVAAPQVRVWPSRGTWSGWQRWPLTWPQGFVRQLFCRQGQACAACRQCIKGVEASQS